MERTAKENPANRADMFPACYVCTKTAYGHPQPANPRDVVCAACVSAENAMRLALSCSGDFAHAAAASVLAPEEWARSQEALEWRRGAKKRKAEHERMVACSYVAEKLRPRRGTVTKSARVDDEFTSGESLEEPVQYKESAIAE
jgi:hypothetical protein